MHVSVFPCIWWHEVCSQAVGQCTDLSKSLVPFHMGCQVKENTYLENILCAAIKDWVTTSDTLKKQSCWTQPRSKKTWLLDSFFEGQAMYFTGRGGVLQKYLLHNSFFSFLGCGCWESSQHQLPDCIKVSPIHTKGKLQLLDSFGSQQSQISGKKGPVLFSLLNTNRAMLSEKPVTWEAEVNAMDIFNFQLDCSETWCDC